MCQFTGHEVFQAVESVQQYVNGKKVQSFLHRTKVDLEFCAENLIFPSEEKPTLLYCELTDSHLAWNQKAIDMHITGRKYIRALWAWREGWTEEEGASATAGSEANPYKLNGVRA